MDDCYTTSAVGDRFLPSQYTLESIPFNYLSIHPFESVRTLNLGNFTSLNQIAKCWVYKKSFSALQDFHRTRFIEIWIQILWLKPVTCLIYSFKNIYWAFFMCQTLCKAQQIQLVEDKEDLCPHGVLLQLGKWKKNKHWTEYFDLDKYKEVSRGNLNQRTGKHVLCNNS